MTTQATTRIITDAEYKAEELLKKAGSRMFDDYWDCESYCDHEAIKKRFNIKNKILHVLVLMRYDPTFRNIANTDISYKYQVFAHRDMAGAYNTDSIHWVVDHPIGDAIIITSNPRKQKMGKADK